MTKLFSSLRLAMLALVSVTTIAGCQLYFGEEDGGGGGGTEPGFPCSGETADAANAQCAAGCYCSAEGVCEEAGFCGVDADCPEGYTCDDRSSCVPNTCESNAECGTGNICQDGQCVATCTCTNDAEAQAVLGADSHCDENLSTCIPGADPAGACVGEVTCNERAPNCGEGTVPLILDGCYTGSCRAIAQCEAAPVCESMQHLTDCSSRVDDCFVVATGTNCTTPGGGICNPGDTNCTCENFEFHSCETRLAVPEN
jgi:hypothetical protein